MKIECDELTRLLEGAKIALDTRASRTVFGCIKLTSQDEWLTASCTDQVLHLETMCHRDGQENINCLIDPDKLLQLARLGGTATLKFNKATITFKSPYVKVAHIPIAEVGVFPDFPEKTKANALHLTKHEIKNLLSAADVLSRTTNSYMQAFSDGEATYISLMNKVGRNVTVTKANTNTNMVVPLGQLRRLLSKFDEFKIELCDHHVFVSGNGYRAMFPDVAGESADPNLYANFERNRKLVYAIKIVGDAFPKQLRAILLFAKEGSPVYLDFQGQQLTMAAFGGETAEMVIDAEVCHLQSNENDEVVRVPLPEETTFTVCFSSIHILKAIEALGPGYEFRLLEHPGGPWLWAKIVRGNVQHYFMPMTPKEV